MIKEYTQEEFKTSEIFKICEEIYLNKFFLENEFSLEDISDLTFYTYHLDSEIIGFGTSQDNEFFNIVDMTFSEKWEHSDKQIDLLNHIIEDINRENKSVFLYQTYERDYNFYLNLGFKLEKDYGNFFSQGKDIMRYVLIYEKV